MHTPIYYRLSQIASTKDVQGLIPVSASTIWRWVSEGKFPKPRSIGQRCTVWEVAEIETWRRKNGQSEGQK